MPRRELCVVSMVVLSLGPAARGQWTAINLSPAGTSSCRALATSDAIQVGQYAAFAARWNSSAASESNLGAIGFANGSSALAISGGRLAGYSVINASLHASFWFYTGPTLNGTDLQPAGSPTSIATGVDATYQVGAAQVGIVLHAARWANTAASFTDLHPAGQMSSYLTGVHNNQMSGYMSAAEEHAGVWPNSSAVIDLNPGGAAGSRALGVHSGQQVGYVVLDGPHRAALWTGTAASFVDLTPSPWPAGDANAVYQGRQVGAVAISGVPHASTWTGTAGSWQDLAPFLAGSWGATFATGVWQSADYIYVCGYGYNNALNREDALLWTRPTCSSAPVISTQPRSMNSCDWQSAVFSVAATSTGTTTYQWQIREQFGPPTWTDLGPGPMSISCGGQASAPPLAGNPAAATITVIGCPGPFQVRVLASNPCGGTLSNAANLTFNTPCRADFNCSGTASVNDIFDFLTAWFAADPRANFNGVGGISVQDIFDFLAAWFQGC